MDFVQAIENLDSQLLCKLFVEDKTVLTKVSNCNLYHHLTDTFNSKPKVQQDGAQLVYILSNYGIDINKQDEDGSTAFHQYLYEADFVHPDVVESFLRCNADVFVRNKEGRSIVDKLRQNSLPKNITDLCLRYMPGLWNAVETDDISTVRKLVNQWCKVDIYKEGKSLIQLALDKGTEDVIRIISGIKVSVALAHGVLAGDLQYVKRMTAGPEKYNINFRNMGDRNATPLYYAACQNFTDLITFLPTLGARTDLCMTYREFDIPTYFSIMMEYPVVNAHTLKILLPKKPFSVDKMYYKGRNILFHCIDCDMHPDIIENILQQSSAEIVTQRIQDNMTARDYAVQENCDNAVNIIDKYVSLWCNNEEYSKQKQILLLHGYTAIPKILQEEVNEEEEEYSESVKGYITQIEDFHEAVEMCESEKVKDLMYCDKCKQLQNCLADSRIQAKGQPALHKAVLRKDMKTCCEIAEALVYQCKQKLDSVRDQVNKYFDRSKGMALPKLFRKTQVRFSAKDDLNLLKEVLAENPYKDKTKWEVVAQNVKENVDKVFNVTSRRVRERTQLLLQQFQKENYEALKRSGTEEEYTEKQQLLQEIQSLAEEEDKEQKEKAQQKDKDEHSAKLIRKRAMEALTPVKISNDSEGVTVTPSKITKIKGNESIMSYLKEKCDVEKDIKMEEVSIRKEELKLERERFEMEREERKQKIENDKQQQLLLMELIKTFFRTALHYAYGMADGKEFVDILMDYGSSDFAVDKDGRSPLAFKDRQELPQMRDLLHYQLLQELETPEPDPWSVRLQMPVVGYLIDCAHSQHKHLPVHMAERLAVELNPIGHSHNSNHHHHHHHESQSLLVGRQPLMNTTNHREMYSSDGPNQNYADQTNGCIDYEDDSDESSDDDRDEINSSSCNIL